MFSAELLPASFAVFCPPNTSLAKVLLLLSVGEEGEEAVVAAPVGEQAGILSAVMGAVTVAWTAGWTAVWTAVEAVGPGRRIVGKGR